MLLCRRLLLHLRSSLSPHSAQCTAFTPSIHRLFSVATPESSPPALTPASQFSVNYLIQSCGLPPDKATRLSRYLPHLKTSEKPDAVLQFLRQAGVSQPHITAAALRHPSFLCYSVEKCLKPRICELLEMGFSPSHISLLFSICPIAFAHTKLQHRVQFWMQILGSKEKLLLLVKRNMFLLTMNPENSVIRNISFFQEECGLTVRQIVQLVMSASRLIFSAPEALDIKVKRAEKLGIPRSSGMFQRALLVVSCLDQSTVDTRLNYFKSLGLSQDDVSLMVSKFPLVLALTEKIIGPKMEFLLKEAGCDNSHIVRFPALLAYSLEKRLIPRNIVRKLLYSKGLIVANQKFFNFLVLPEEKFVKKFVLPHEESIPGLHQAYIDACAGKSVAL